MNKYIQFSNILMFRNRKSLNKLWKENNKKFREFSWKQLITNLLLFLLKIVNVVFVHLLNLFCLFSTANVFLVKLCSLFINISVSNFFYK